MPLTPDHITIAITVYDRREFLLQAIRSALDQTIPVRVMVVEDCGPDEKLQEWIKSEFGNRIEYYRNPLRRGLFDNWNACVELCQTEWLSILHDDDFLAPDFVAAMLKLYQKAPGLGLYFGVTNVVDAKGRFIRSVPPHFGADWKPLDLLQCAYDNPVGFPGQLFRKDAVLSLGGFRPGSLYCGDWEMWFKLGAEFGGAQTCEVVASLRQHRGFGRGTSRVDLSGKRYGLVNVQIKRNLALLAQHDFHLSFCRKLVLKRFPLPTKFLIAFGGRFSKRYLAYNGGLLLASPACNWKYFIFQSLTRIFGPVFIKLVSRLCKGILE